MVATVENPQLSRPMSRRDVAGLRRRHLSISSTVKHEQGPVRECGRGVKRTSHFELAGPLVEISRKCVVGDDANPAAMFDKSARLASPVVEISPSRDRCNTAHPLIGRGRQQGQAATCR